MDGQTLQAWIDYVFDHPVGDVGRAWYWAEDAPEWPGPREEIPSLIAETFERASELLARFSDEELDQGFWFLVGTTPPEFMETLVDDKILLEARLRALRSFVPLFEQMMAVRCPPLLSSLEESGMSPLNSACYMWWDLLRWQWGRDPGDTGAQEPRYVLVDQEPDRALFDQEVVLAMSRILAISHDACRESALHGVGHLDDLILVNPPLFRRAAQIVDEFLGDTIGLRPEVIAYAESARLLNVL